ncbi:MAG: hypothetical protein EHM70_01955 [Chloroflexota bacterium]|nr:MAG: hypothetical protein EHM70_01955 [Chloroflexota bacterium]
MSVEEHVIEQLPAYALGALDEDDTLAVIRHLNQCAACQVELRAYEAVANQLGFAAPVAEPPPHLKKRILEHQALKKRMPSRSRELTHLPLAWGLVGILVIAILAASNLFLWREVALLRAEREPQVFQTVAMAGTELNPDARGVIIISADGKHGTLVVDDLPRLDEEHEYQLWLIRDGRRTSGGTFNVGREGYGSLWVSASDPLDSYPAFGVTIEPAGGSPAPTGEKVLGGEF